MLRFPIDIANLNVSPDSKYLFVGIQHTQLFLFNLGNFEELGYIITEMKLRNCAIYMKNTQIYFVSLGDNGLKDRGETIYDTIILWKLTVNNDLKLVEEKKIRIECKLIDDDSWFYLPTNLVVSDKYQAIFGEFKHLFIVDLETEAYESFVIPNLNVNTNIDINTEEELILIGGRKLIVFDIKNNTKGMRYKSPGKLSGYPTTYNVFVNDTFLIAGFYNGELVLWNLKYNDSLIRFGDHRTNLINIKLTMDRKVLVTVGNTIIKFWNFLKIKTDSQSFMDNQLSERKVRKKQIKERDEKMEANTKKYILELYESYKQVSLDYITFTTHIKKERLKSLIVKMIMNKEIEALILGDFLIFNIHFFR
jgi:hypothetical protein